MHTHTHTRSYELLDDSLTDEISATEMHLNDAYTFACALLATNLHRIVVEHNWSVQIYHQPGCSCCNNTTDRQTKG